MTCEIAIKAALDCAQNQCDILKVCNILPNIFPLENVKLSAV